MKIYITYYIPVFGDYKFNIIRYEGPYQKIFDSSDDAMDWIRNNNIDNYNVYIVNIDMV